MFASELKLKGRSSLLNIKIRRSDSPCHHKLTSAEGNGGIEQVFSLNGGYRYTLFMILNAVSFEACRKLQSNPAGPFHPLARPYKFFLLE